MLKVYDAKMVPLYNEDKKIVHQQALWHKVVTGIVFNKQTNSLYFQTIYPKDSYTFDRPDYIDFSIGGHVEDDENINDAILTVNTFMCSCYFSHSLTPLNESQYFYI